MMQTIINRLKEPSTYAGLAGVLASLGVLGLGEDQWGTILAAVAGVAGAVAVFVGEAGSDA